MDDYLLDEDIIRIIERFWKAKVDHTFYNNCPEVRDAFFSKPYPAIAATLGYPLPDETTTTTAGFTANNPAAVGLNLAADEYVDLTKG